MTLRTDLVDLRSDTVTRPTPAMRRAIAEAVVGDDVYGDDPTVLALEERVARLTVKDAALYVPSGTMGNQLAVACQTQPGDEVLLEADSHVFVYEQGGIAANSGTLAHPMPSDRGAIDPVAIAAAVRGEDDHVAHVRLLCIENTHNRHGGAIVPLERVRAAAAAAHQYGMAVHMDGARLWNASVASGIPLADWAAPVDTVMMCFSKALGAPVGSILAGPADVIHRAHRLRKRWGGGMRQVGILAAACLYALDHHIERLADDHARARVLADAIATLPGIRVVAPQTNIVFMLLEHPSLDGPDLARRLFERGVHLSAYGPKKLRAITHLDIDDAGVERAVEAFRAVVGEVLGVATA